MGYSIALQLGFKYIEFSDGLHSQQKNQYLGEIKIYLKIRKAKFFPEVKYSMFLLPGICWGALSESAYLPYSQGLRK